MARRIRIGEVESDKLTTCRQPNFKYGNGSIALLVFLLTAMFHDNLVVADV